MRRGTREGGGKEEEERGGRVKKSKPGNTHTK